MLVVTALEDVTADWVIEELNARAIRVARVDPADIGLSLMFDARITAQAARWSGSLRTTTRDVDLLEVGSVYYRRPGRWRFDHLPAQQQDFAAGEARHGLGGVLYNLDGALYVNHPAAVTRADFKPGQLQTAAQLGLMIPPTLITNDIDAARKFATEHGQVIYKTFRGLPTGDADQAGAIWAQRVDPAMFDNSMTVTAQLFQAEVPKTSDVRVTAIGGRVFAQRITAPGHVLDWRQGDWDQLTHTPAEVPPSVTTAMHRYLASYDLAFGCFDFALTGDADDARNWVFIECNPNGQWAWLPDADQIASAFADVLCREESGT